MRGLLVTGAAGHSGPAWLLRPHLCPVTGEGSGSPAGGAPACSPLEPGSLAGRGSGQEYLVLEMVVHSSVLRWLSTSEWWASTWLASPLSVAQVLSWRPSSARSSPGAPGSR